MLAVALLALSWLPESARLDGRPEDRFYFSFAAGTALYSAQHIDDQLWQNGANSGSIPLDHPKSSPGWAGAFSLTWWGNDYLGLDLVRMKFADASAFATSGCAGGGAACQGKHMSVSESEFSMGLRVAAPLRFVQPYVFVGPHLQTLTFNDTAYESGTKIYAGKINAGVGWAAGLNGYLGPRSRLFAEIESSGGSFTTPRPAFSATGHRLDVRGFQGQTVMIGFSWSPVFFRELSSTKGTNFKAATIYGPVAFAALICGASMLGTSSNTGRETSP